MRKRRSIAATVMLAIWTCAAAPPKTVTLTVGNGQRLEAESSGAGALRWISSDSAVAEVYQNGWVIGLKPGNARICPEGAAIEWTVTVSATSKQLRDPRTIKQLQTNEIFELDGRKCAGCELNGHVLGVPNKGVLENNRIINPKPLAEKKELFWEVEPETEVVDGAGVRMGVVAPTVRVGEKKVPASAFNYGMTKVIGGKLYVYGFGTGIVVDPKIQSEMDASEVKNGVIGTSAWVPLNSIVDKETLLDRLGVGRGKLPALPLQADRYRITGENPRAYLIREGELGIVKEINGPVPSHYLRRPSGTINVLYSVPGFGFGGQGLDSFLIVDGLTFRPARGVRQFVQPTYFPKAHPRAGQVAPKTMTFIYGAVEAPGCDPVYGWVANEAMERI